MNWREMEVLQIAKYDGGYIVAIASDDPGRSVYDTYFENTFSFYLDRGGNLTGASAYADSQTVSSFLGAEKVCPVERNITYTFPEPDNDALARLIREALAESDPSGAE